MSGSSLAHYEILALIGRGGMGEVHRARDTKLGREVALKLLPEDFASDPERLARFRREAKVLASLHHPNIAGIFGLEEDNNRVFLAMELAEGTDLSQRIQKGAIPEEEVLDIARQVAAGLEEAHENNVVHRDLKPANIMLGTDGKVKILDFGLARAYVGDDGSEASPQNSPTITAAMTQAGMIMGTAAYMSPEQARGKNVDRRADIWSFGVVLFEMLTGRQLFEGETISDTLAAVLRADIDWSQLPENTSHGMRVLLERCLERDPLRRLRDIGEARIFLEAGAKDSSLLASASSVFAAAAEVDHVDAKRGLPLFATIAIALALAAAGTVVGWKVLGASTPPIFNTAIPSPKDAVFHLNSTRPGPAAISPDGSMVVYAARDESNSILLHLRHLDSPHGTAIAGTDNAAYPFWSPDSRYIGFSGGADGKIKKVAVSGGPPITLCAAGNMKGGSWNQSGVIVFAPASGSGIQRVSASGGEPVDVTKPKSGVENSHRHPRFLPDGDRFLFLARLSGSNDEHNVYLGSLSGEEPKLVTTSQAVSEYSNGHLLTVREGILFATPFDPESGELGEGVPLVEDLLVIPSAAYALFSSTLDGMLVYQESTRRLETTLEWLGDGDVQLGRVGDPGALRRPRVSPDGMQAVVEVRDPDTDETDLWLVDLNSGLRSRFTFDRGNEEGAEWTPDGKTILFTAEVDSIERVMTRPVEGAGGASILYEGTHNLALSGVSPDGKTVLLARDDVENSWNAYSLDIETGELKLLIETEAADFGAVLSPDGRWLAYSSGRSGVWNIYVRPASGGDRRWQVNRADAFYPFWGPDGNSLYYVEPPGEIKKVPVDGSGSTFRAGAPQMFATVAPVEAEGIHVSMHPDGDRVLHVPGEDSEDERGYLHLVTDWKRGLVK